MNGFSRRNTIGKERAKLTTCLVQCEVSTAACVEPVESLVDKSCPPVVHAPPQPIHEGPEIHHARLPHLSSIHKTTVASVEGAPAQAFIRPRLVENTSVGGGRMPGLPRENVHENLVWKASYCCLRSTLQLPISTCHAHEVALHPCRAGTTGKCAVGHQKSQIKAACYPHESPPRSGRRFDGCQTRLEGGRRRAGPCESRSLRLLGSHPCPRA